MLLFFARTAIFLGGLLFTLIGLSYMNPSFVREAFGIYMHPEPLFSGIILIGLGIFFLLPPLQKRFINALDGPPKKSCS